MLSGSERQRGNISVLVKKRKMGHDLDFNDSGVPMDGVELDSSTVSRSATSPHSQVSASTTNPAQNNSDAKQNNDRLMSDNEAIASDNQYYPHFEDSKLSDDLNLDLAKSSSTKLSHNSNSSSEGNSHRNRLSHNDTSHGNTQSSNPEILRSFGDLFDDDDLD